ncbi:MAG TPA: ribonuclease III [Chthonomonadaceae bacterium]|nr:ribonuclease III [Chthonomonadaceae bacterium]
MDSDALAQLQEKLGVRFKNEALLRQALIHRSAAAERSLDSNERLEFLGDSVVGLVVSENLFRLFPDYSEGNLAKAKAYVVSESALAEAALAIGLEAFVVMSAGEAASGGRTRRSILADTFEAVIAAIYLDCGLRTARRIVQKALKDAIREVEADEHRRDYKSSLQEQTQAHLRKAPIYRIVSETGRDHEKVFVAEAVLGTTVIGQGSGRNKKEAEQAAALDALDHLPRFLPDLVADAPKEAESGVQ